MAGPIGLMVGATNRLPAATFAAATSAAGWESSNLGNADVGNLGSKWRSSNAATQSAAIDVTFPVAGKLDYLQVVGTNIRPAGQWRIRARDAGSFAPYPTGDADGDTNATTAADVPFWDGVGGSPWVAGPLVTYRTLNPGEKWVGSMQRPGLTDSLPHCPAGQEFGIRCGGVDGDSEITVETLELREGDDVPVGVPTVGYVVGIPAAATATLSNTGSVEHFWDAEILTAPASPPDEEASGAAGVRVGITNTGKRPVRVYAVRWSAETSSIRAGVVRDTGWLQAGEPPSDGELDAAAVRGNGRTLSHAFLSLPDGTTTDPWDHPLIRIDLRGATIGDGFFEASAVTGGRALAFDMVSDVASVLRDSTEVETKGGLVYPGLSGRVYGTLSAKVTEERRRLTGDLIPLFTSIQRAGRPMAVIYFPGFEGALPRLSSGEISMWSMWAVMTKSSAKIEHPGGAFSTFGVIDLDFHEAS